MNHDVDTLGFEGVNEAEREPLTRDTSSPVCLGTKDTAEIVRTVQLIAATISDRELSLEYVIPSVFDRRVAEAVARSFEDAAHKTGIARRKGATAVSWAATS